MKLRKLQAHRLLALSLVILAFNFALGQVPQVRADTMPPVPGAGFDYVHALAETVDPQTGSLSIRIAIPVPPGRDLAIPFTFGYDSNVALHHVENVSGFVFSGWTDNASYLGRSGWHYVVPTLSVFSGTYVNGSGSGGNTTCHFFDNYIFNDAQGTPRGLGISQSDQQVACQPSSILQLLVNGDGAYGAIATQMNFNQATPPPVTVADVAGTVYQFSNALARIHNYPGDNQNNVNSFSLASSIFTSLPDSIETRNGNIITVADQGQGAFLFTDQLGRPVLQSNGFGGNGNTIQVSGTGTYTVNWSPQSYNWPYNSQISSSNPNAGSCGQTVANVTGSQPVITQIKLPNNQSFQFQYDSVTGLVNQITYPSGAVVSYTWAANPLSASEGYPQLSGLSNQCTILHDTPAVFSRTVKFDGVNAALEQDFTYSTTWGITDGPGSLEPGLRQWSSKQTTVVTKDLVTGVSFKTLYTYNVPVALNLASSLTTATYDTNGSNAKVLRTEVKNWNQPTLLPVNVTATLDTGQTSQVITCIPSASAVAPCSNSTSNFRYIINNASGTAYSTLPTDTYEYDYGSGAPGPLLRQTHTDYAQFSATPWGTMIANRPSDVITYDGNAKKLAEVDYKYDETGLGPASATAHDDQNYTTGYKNRGNLTTQIRKCFPLPPATQTCSDSITTYMYDQTGQQVSKTDPNGNPTIYGFTDSFVDPAPPSNAPSPPGNTNAYLTKITYSSTNGTSHNESFSYAYSDGVLTVATDQNGNQTKYTYNDPLRRLTRTDLADSGQTQVTYTDSTPSPSAVTTKKITGTVNLVSTAVMDGMGHNVQTQLNSDPVAVDFTDIAYNGVGHTLSISNPHRSGSSSTDGTTRNQYDSLGRVTQVTKQDGSISSMSYSGNCTTITDEATRQRKACTDGLGRLIEVHEPGDDFNGSEAQGSFNVSGSLQTYTIQGTNATSGHGSVTINGSEQWISGGTYCNLYNENGDCVDWEVNPPTYDGGTVTITVNGHADSYSYGSGDTTGTIAAGLASAINNDGGAPVTASASGSTVNLTSKATGSASNYSLSSSYAWDSGDFANPSFTTSNSGGALTGGANGTSPTTVYDNGTVTVTIGSFTASAPYSQSGNSTGAQVAAALAGNGPTGLSRTGSPVTATAAGSTVNITYTSIGAAGDISVGCSSSTSQTAYFAGPSFSCPSSTALSGGYNPEGPSLDFNYFVTQYSYDGLGNLLNVTQKGDPTFTNSSQWRVRTFTYDSLSRLLTATNPESGTISYSYDANGNLLQKTSPAPNQTGTATVVTSYAYDFLNRLTAKSYSDGTTQTAYFAYDTVANWGITQNNLVGRLSATWVNGALQAGEIFSYDPLGRVVMHNQCTPSNCGAVSWPLSYSYDLAGDMTSYTIGAVPTFTQSFDSVGHLTQITSSMVSAQHPATLATVDPSVGYYPSGDIRKMTLGNGLTETSAFNVRLQPCRANVNSSSSALLNCTDPVPTGTTQDFTYGFGGTNNNGNLISFSGSGNQNFNRTYSYDALNRLASLAAPGDSCTGLSWAYDAWGNRTDQTVTGGTCYSFHQLANQQNRLAGSYQYDAAGNLTNDGNHSYTYDAENRLIQVDGGATASYTYDAEGRRVRKTTGGTWMDYIYDLSGNVVTEKISPVGTCAPICWEAGYIYLNGRLMAIYKDGTTYFVHKDHLGTTRVLSNMDQSIKDSMDYLPYGEQIAGDTGITHKLTGKERDSETLFDYFGARYYSNSIGQFATPDEPFADQDTGTPQSWNLYNYARNNPTTFVDADGRSVQVCFADRSDGAQTCQWMSDDEYKNGRSGDNPGVQYPGGNKPEGDITCGGQVCGSVRWAPSPTPNTMSDGAVIPGTLGPLDFLLFGSGRSLFSFGARQTGGTIGTEVGVAGGRGLLTATEGVLVSNGTKAAARDVIEGMADGAQKASLKRGIAAAGNQAKVTVQGLSDGSVRLMINRTGVDGGQTIIKTVAADGSSSTVQVGVNGAGTLTHFDVKR